MSTGSRLEDAPTQRLLAAARKPSAELPNSSDHRFSYRPRHLRLDADEHLPTSPDPEPTRAMHPRTMPDVPGDSLRAIREPQVQAALEEIPVPLPQRTPGEMLESAPLAMLDHAEAGPLSKLRTMFQALRRGAA